MTFSERMSGAEPDFEERSSSMSDLATWHESRRSSLRRALHNICDLRCVMRLFHLALVFSVSATFCHAQAATDDATFLKQARAKYDAPFGRNLQSLAAL